MKNIFYTTLLSCALTYSAQAVAPSAQDVVKNYALIAHANYADTHKDAQSLHNAIEAFLAKPTEINLTAAKDAWLVARNSYGQTEAFRFYEGPIDFVDPDTGKEGPEGSLNAWPVNEAYIDYVQGDATTGIVQNTDITINKETLSSKNQEQDEADVSTGYHAIEFLLWGQDLSLESAGTRPASDYADTPENSRRRAYLKAVSELLIDDVAFLNTSWLPEQDNYAKSFISKDTKKSLSQIMSSLATLSGFELASERIATALDSGDQEDEHSCFSDNTHNDFIVNAQGIRNVYFGHYGKLQGASLHALLEANDTELASKLADNIRLTETQIAALPHPIDSEILATPEGSEARAQMEQVVESLQTQADLFKAAGKVLGLDVAISE